MYFRHLVACSNLTSVDNLVWCNLCYLGPRSIHDMHVVWCWFGNLLRLLAWTEHSLLFGSFIVFFLRWAHSLFVQDQVQSFALSYFFSYFSPVVVLKTLCYFEHSSCYNLFMMAAAGLGENVRWVHLFPHLRRLMLKCQLTRSNQVKKKMHVSYSCHYSFISGSYQDVFHSITNTTCFIL
jgi:hypothetical protein